MQSPGVICACAIDPSSETFVLTLILMSLGTGDGGSDRFH